MLRCLHIREVNFFLESGFIHDMQRGNVNCTRAKVHFEKSSTELAVACIRDLSQYSTISNNSDVYGIHIRWKHIVAPAIDKLQSLGASKGRDKISEGVQTAVSK